jgi:hypothetical protein
LDRFAEREIMMRKVKLSLIFCSLPGPEKQSPTLLISSYQSLPLVSVITGTLGINSWLLSKIVKMNM